MSTYIQTAPPRERTLAKDARLLRGALKLDAAVTGANGIAYLAAAGALDGLLGVPAGVLRAIGAFLIVFAAAVLFAGTRTEISCGAVLAIVAANALWVVDSVIVAAAGVWSPATAGTVWTLMQAAVVAGFAALQLAGLRRSAAPRT